MVIAIVPFIAYLINADALWEFVDIYLRFNVEYSASEGRALAIIRTIYIFITPLLITSFVIIFLCICRGRMYFFNTAYLVYMVLAMVTLSMSGRGYIHYGMVLIPLFTYPLAVCLKELKQDFFSCTVLLSVVLIVTSTYYIHSTYKLLAGIMSSSDDVCTDEVVNYVITNTSEQEKILVIGYEDIIYLECDRLCASKYSYQVPITSVSTEIYNDFYNEITLNKPSLIVVPVENENFDGLEDYIDENHYIEVLTNDEYIVLTQ